MKNLKDFIYEEMDVVYGVYMEDGTAYNFFNDENEAQECRDKLNKENPDNNASIKKEKKSSVMDE